MMQESMYKFCGVDPVSFWKYTPAESVMMISVASDKYVLEYEIRDKYEARLCAIILTANGVMKSKNTPFDVDDFASSNSKPKQKKTVEQLEAMAKMSAMRMGGEIKQL